ncbi:MAG: AMP-binding protein, partial [Candidatus Margulisiibacteriota bacterium]
MGTPDIIPTQTFSGFENAQIDSMKTYHALYKRSTENPEAFWADMAQENIDWFKSWDTVLESDLSVPKVSWFKGGKLNVSYNCLDRHVKSSRRNKAALICESESSSQTYTYQQLYYKVNRFANVLKKHGIRKGDRVTIYLPMIGELAIAMMACARIGAIHSVVFAGFSANALKDRILDCESKLLITADNFSRGEKTIFLKQNVDEAVHFCPSIKKVIVVNV